MNADTATTNPALWSEYHAQIPLQRPGKTNDIRDMALILLSDQAQWITGKIYEVDGGHVL